MAMASLWKTPVVLIAVLCGVPLVLSQSFSTEPRDAKMLINTPAVMRCSISEPTAIVFWSVPGTSSKLVVESDRAFTDGTPGRFTVEGEAGSGDFNLKISEVQAVDQGLYTCNFIVNDGRGDISLAPATFRSQPATLTVIQLPSTGDPVCWIKEGEVAAVGDTLSLMCASSNPLLGLTWYVGDVPLSHSPFDINSQGTGIDSEFLAQSSADQETFTCQPNMGQFDACEVTVQVRHSPIVNIKADSSMETGQDASFQCVATGNPSNFAYTWHYNDYRVSFEQNPRFNRARLEQSGSVLVLPDLADGDNSTVLRCEVVNAAGVANATHVIRAEPGKTLAQIIGPILLGIILGLVLIVIVAYAMWWRGQRRKVKQINKKKKSRLMRTLSGRNRQEIATVDSGIVYTQTVGGFGSRYGKTATSNGDLARSGLDLESAGYGPDVTSIPAYRATTEQELEDDGELRPIPRKKSTSSLSSLANGGRGFSTSADDGALISPSEEKSFTYYVNPNFDEYRNSAVMKGEENDLNPEEKEMHPYNIGGESPELKPNNDYGEDDNVISTEL